MDKITTGTSTGPTTATLTPADFQSEVDAFNTKMDAAIRAKADADTALAKLMETRETVIAGAGEFGVTSKYARALLRKI